MGNKDALVSLGLMPLSSYFRHFTWVPARPISYIELYTKQTQTMQPKAQGLRTDYF